MWECSSGMGWWIQKIEQMTPALPINNKYHWDIQPHYSIHLNKSRLCFGWQWKRKRLRLRLRLRLPRVYRIDVVWIHSIKKETKMETNAKYIECIWLDDVNSSSMLWTVLLYKLTVFIVVHVKIKHTITKRYSNNATLFIQNKRKKGTESMVPLCEVPN